jgi:hypothetical protein
MRKIARKIGATGLAAGAELALAFLLLAASAPGVARAGRQASLAVADVVDREGRPHWPEGYAGPVDIGHYDLVTAANGEPRFLPHDAPQETAEIPAAEAGWTGFGAVRHGCAGPINAMLRMPNGDLILGGGFHLCGNVYAEGVIRWDGHRWSALTQPPTLPGFGTLIGSGAVHALALRGSDLIVAGAALISTAEGSQFDVARWDGTAWHALVPGVKINEASSETLQGVRAIAVVGTDVYLGGDISNATFNDGSPPLDLRNLARWDGTAWHAVTGTSAGCDPTIPGADGVVNALATDGANLYVGGDFVVVCSKANNSPRPPGVVASHVARWNAGTWSSLGSGGENGVDGVVNALAFAAGSLYVGGSFGAAGSKQASNLARWDGAGWNPVGIGAANGVSSTVDALAVFAGKLYVGGAFKFAGAVSALRVAQWDGSQWSALAQGLGTTAAGDTGPVNAMLADTQGVFASGAIVAINGGDIVDGVARWTGSAWQPLVDVSDFTMIDGHVNAFAVRGGDLFVGGAITRVGEVPVNNVARWNGSAWSSLGSAANNGVDGEVFALSTTPNNVYVGGAFTHAAGQVANHVARWDGGAWHPMGGAGSNGVDDSVRALASASDTAVFAGGDFIHAGGQVANFIAAWNGSTWNPLTASNGVGVCGAVTALAVSGTGVYAGGSFPDPSGCPPGAALTGNHVSFWTGSQWNDLLEQGAIGNGVNARVNALLVSGSDLYVGGIFNQVVTANGVLSTPRVVRWRNGAWNSLAVPAALNADFVLSLGTLQGKVYAGTLGETVYRFDEQPFPSWQAIDIGGLSMFPINALANVGSKLYAGGKFFEISAFPNAASNAWALYQTPIIFANGFEQ